MPRKNEVQIKFQGTEDTKAVLSKAAGVLAAGGIDVGGYGPMLLDLIDWGLVDYVEAKLREAGNDEKTIAGLLRPLKK